MPPASTGRASQSAGGTLFVVATPIGNLEDITIRALRVLRDAHVIAAEDTRRTARLLARHGIPTPALSFHEHNTRSRIPQLLARLDRGERVALVTDAGTPCLSDPGIELVRACIEQGLTVDPVPGASAPLTAAVTSGFPMEPLTILGFPPSRSKDRSAWFESASKIDNTLTFFEAPHRIIETLTVAAVLFGNRPIMVGRELTKAHQEFIRGDSMAAIVGRLANTKGEFTVVVGPRTAPEAVRSVASDADVLAEFGRTTETKGVSRRQAINVVARRHGRSARDVYALIEAAKKSGL